MQAATTPIVVRQLLTAMRHQARSMEIARLAVDWRDRGVAGFDIACAEDGYPPTCHLDAFEYPQREPAHFHIHTHEPLRRTSVWHDLQCSGVGRVRHVRRLLKTQHTRTSS